MTSSITAPVMPGSITLSLVAHTNVGKTTLARTLLQRDVGQVRDAPHVTEFAEDHLLLRSPAGDELRLWDTPGFGDSVRLVRRLRQRGNPIGWFLSEVWDRWRDPPFWASQHVVRHVRERTDLVLYLVNASESPESAAHVGPEMELLAWIRKPVIVLLNQLGAPRTASEEMKDVERWRAFLSKQGYAHEVMALDAFARCWVQEAVLLRAAHVALPVSLQGAMTRLMAQWAAQRMATFDRAVESLAQSLARVATTRVPIDGGSGLGAAFQGAVRMLSAWFAREGRQGDDALHRAQAALVALMDAEIRRGTVELIELHGLDGNAQGEILSRVDRQFDVRTRMDTSRAAVLGAIVSGAMTGLGADLASGGLTLGGGLLAGGLLGALGAAGVARGINVLRGGGPPSVGWSAEALSLLTVSALLRYLAVAHFGRGRGQWSEGEAPRHWQQVVSDALAPRRHTIDALWASRQPQKPVEQEAIRLARALQPELSAALRAALERLYPGCWPASVH